MDICLPVDLTGSRGLELTLGGFSSVLTIEKVISFRSLHLLIREKLSQLIITTRMPTLPAFETPAPKPEHAILSFPAQHVLQVTLSRPNALNCVNLAGHHELHAVWEWMDREPSLRVGVITGEGRAFCAGADLKGEEIQSRQDSYQSPLVLNSQYLHSGAMIPVSSFKMQ